ncbi:MAG TPA: CPBP family glutamic-type intramembrane protease [Polyangiaceae bacterium]|jgi:hypothetical protein
MPNDNGRGVMTRTRSGPWADLALTLPIFIAYHLGVVFLQVRNAADLVTRELVTLAHNSTIGYFGLTLGIGAVFVATLVVLGRSHSLRWDRFALVAAEGVLYALAMRLMASYVVGRLFLGPLVHDRSTGLIMSLGAGFYEEIGFRVVLFGFGAQLLSLLFSARAPLKALLIRAGWAALAAAAFSGWHYVGALGESFDLKSFTFRWVCGMAFTAIYAFRGFAPAVWTHALYDIWVLVL